MKPGEYEINKIKKDNNKKMKKEKYSFDETNKNSILRSVLMLFQQRFFRVQIIDIGIISGEDVCCSHCQATLFETFSVVVVVVVVDILLE